MKALEIALSVHVVPGHNIGRAIEQAQILAASLLCLVEFDFNGIHMCVGPNSDPVALFDRYSRACLARTVHEQREYERTSKPIAENVLITRVPLIWRDDDFAAIWNWWNAKAELDTMEKFYEFLKDRGLAE